MTFWNFSSIFFCVLKSHSKPIVAKCGISSSLDKLHQLPNHLIVDSGWSTRVNYHQHRIFKGCHKRQLARILQTFGLPFFIAMFLAQVGKQVDLSRASSKAVSSEAFKDSHPFWDDKCSKALPQQADIYCSVTFHIFHMNPLSGYIPCWPTALSPSSLWRCMKPVMTLSWSFVELKVTLWWLTVCYWKLPLK